MKTYITILYSITVLLSACQSKPAADRSPWGVSAHPNRAQELAHADEAFAYVQDGGIRWMREDFCFAKIYDGADFTRFADYDALLDRAEQHGVQILPILQAYDNELREAGHDSLTPIYRHPDEWRAFVRAVASRYHTRVKHWEIWNEQDGGFWKPAPDARQYVPLLQIACEEIKRIDPGAQVMVGGLCWWNVDYLRAMYAAGAQGSFDMIAVHPYNEGLDMNPKALRQMQEFRQLVRRHEGRDLPVWITECGGTAFTGQLFAQQPDFMVQAVRYALAKLGHKPCSEGLTVGLALSPRDTHPEEIARTRAWLPGVHLRLIPFDELPTLDPADCPVLIGAEGLNIDEPLLAPLHRYVREGGLLLGVNKVPFHTVHYPDSTGTWQREDRQKETYPLFRMRFDAWFTQAGLPESTTDVRLSPDAAACGLPAVHDIQVDRFLSGRNMRSGDRYHPILTAYHEGKPVGEGMALYTYGDWRGGVLLSTISLDTGYTAEEQAALLQRVYLTYLAAGVERIFWYDLHNDGCLPGDREHNFGLFTYDWQPKAAYHAYREMTDALGNAPRFVERLAGTDDSDWRLVFRRTEDNRLVEARWTAGSSERVRFSACTSGASPAADLTRYVDPFIGTADNGHTYPGATVPFGMIQASPETGNGSWRYCSGYNIEDDSIAGFAQTHLNGTGCPDLGDILLLPLSGNAPDVSGKRPYDRASQQASPGYYAVRLTDPDVLVELTATQRTAFHRYTFREGEHARLLVDLQSGIWDKDMTQRVLSAELDLTVPGMITGRNRVRAWVEREVCFALAFDRPYTVDTLPARPGEKARRLLLDFGMPQGGQVQVKAALSTVDVEGAKAALAAESPGWQFDSLREQARAQWNDLLGRAQVTGTDAQKTNFYTSLYHLCIQPNNIADVDGRYRGADDRVRTSPTGTYYSTFSLWDTYRAAHPLYTILLPDRVDGMVQTMLDHFDAQGFLPIWTLWGKENYCMIGNHAIPVIVDACLKGFRGFSHAKAYEAVRTSSTVPHLHSDWDVYTRYGYYPFDLVPTESVSRTLESAYDDWCVARLAGVLGHTADSAAFMERSRCYRRLFDPSVQLMRGKDSAGRWRTPFNSFSLSHAATSGGDYTEGNAWQYTWHVQHDVPGLIALFGSEEAFCTKLDSLFLLDAAAASTGFVSDVTGLIGQYAHGNEPSHHVIFLYTFAGQARRTQELVREVFDRFYLPRPDGLCGNDDCGQMSAWYIFSAMGFYPVNPVGGEYVLGAPQLPEVSLHLPEGKVFTVRAEGLSEQNKYVRAVHLNGKPLTGNSIQHEDIMAGGELVFTMCAD